MSCPSCAYYRDQIDRAAREAHLARSDLQGRTTGVERLHRKAMWAEAEVKRFAEQLRAHKEAAGH